MNVSHLVDRSSGVTSCGGEDVVGPSGSHKIPNSLARRQPNGSNANVMWMLYCRLGQKIIHNGYT